MELVSKSSLFLGIFLLASALHSTAQDELTPQANKDNLSRIELSFILESLTDGTSQASLHEKMTREDSELTPAYVKALIDFMNIACSKAIKQYPMVTAALYTMQLNELGCIYVYSIKTEDGKAAQPLVFWHAFEHAADILPEELIQEIKMIQKNYLQ